MKSIFQSLLTMKPISVLVLAAVLAILTGCANQGEPPNASATTQGRAEGDFNSNNSMPSAW